MLPLFLFREKNSLYYGRKTHFERMIKMLPIVVKVAQIAAGVVVGIKASDAMDKYIVEPIEKVIKNKKKGA